MIRFPPMVRCTSRWEVCARKGGLEEQCKEEVQGLEKDEQEVQSGRQRMDDACQRSEDLVKQCNVGVLCSKNTVK